MIQYSKHRIVDFTKMYSLTPTYYTHAIFEKSFV